MIGIYATGITGGTSDDLDYIAGDDVAMLNGTPGLVLKDGVCYNYILNTTSGSTADGVTIVSPATNPGTVRWILQTSYGVLSMFGVDQTWQDVLSSRFSGVVYTNTTDRPIMLSVVVQNTGAVIANIEVDGDVVINVIDRYTASSIAPSMVTVVPPGSTYEVTVSNGTLSAWKELRD